MMRIDENVDAKTEKERQKLQRIVIFLQKLKLVKLSDGERNLAKIEKAVTHREVMVAILEKYGGHQKFGTAMREQVFTLRKA